MKKIANFIKASESAWLDKIVENPETGNKVKVKSLPVKDREKYRPKETLHDEARKGNTDILHHPSVSTHQTGNLKNTPLHVLAGEGVKDVLKHPHVAKIKNTEGTTPLHYLAHQGEEAILEHPDASKVKDDSGDTPMHWLASKENLSKNAIRETLKHPDVAKVKNNSGQTPLHELANQGVVAALDHPDANKVKDKKGRTPKDVYEKNFGKLNR